MRNVLIALCLLTGCTKPAPAPLPLTTDHAPDEHGWGTAGGIHYREIVRGGADPDEPLPLLVVFHGMEGSANVRGLEGLDVEEGVKARVIRAQAPIALGDDRFSWFDSRLIDDASPEQKAAGIADQLVDVVRMLDTLRAQRPTRGQTVVAGFSQGGMLSYALAAKHPERVGFALPVSGYLPRPLWPESSATATPTVHALHGTRDDIVDERDAEALVAHLRAHGFRAELTPFPDIDHRISPEMGALARRTLSAAVLAP